MNILTKLLVIMGARTPCCGACLRDEGMKRYCTNCNKGYKVGF